MIEPQSHSLVQGANLLSYLAPHVVFRHKSMYCFRLLRLAGSMKLLDLPGWLKNSRKPFALTESAQYYYLPSTHQTLATDLRDPENTYESWKVATDISGLADPDTCMHTS